MVPSGVDGHAGRPGQPGHQFGFCAGRRVDQPQDAGAFLSPQLGGEKAAIGEAVQRGQAGRPRRERRIDQFPVLALNVAIWPSTFHGP